MKVEIVISCQDKKDLMNHLSVIRQQINQELKNNPEPEDITLEDGNIYGEHSIKINPK